MDEGLLPFPNGGMIESRWKKDEVMMFAWCRDAD